jgi:hypothetical protein
MSISNINHFNALSLSQAYNFNKNFTPPTTDSYQGKLDLLTFNTQLQKINSSLVNYKPSLMQFIKDIFTLKAFKIYHLRRSLPTMVSTVNRLAETVLQDPIIPKAKLVEKAIKHVEKNQKTELDQKVCSYLKGVLKDLQNNNNVPLPRWYHATGARSSSPESAIDIIKSGRIRPATAYYPEVGHIYLPACASSSDEVDYGDFTFALDHHNTWGDKQVVYYDNEKGGSYKNVNNTIWIHAGGESIKAQQDNIAFIATKADKIELVKDELNKIGKNILVVDREFSDSVRRALESVEDTVKTTTKYAYSSVDRVTRSLPAHWNNKWKGTFKVNAQ